MDRALCGLSPDDAEFAACCAIMAILMKRAGDEGRGRYLEVAKHGGACPELERREAFGEASAADAEPDGVTRIVGSRVPPPADAATGRPRRRGAERPCAHSMALVPRTAAAVHAIDAPPAGEATACLAVSARARRGDVLAC